MGRRRKEGSIDPFANRDYKGTPLCPLSFAPSSSLSSLPPRGVSKRLFRAKEREKKCCCATQHRGCIRVTRN